MKIHLMYKIILTIPKQFKQQSEVESLNHEELKILCIFNFIPKS